MTVSQSPRSITPQQRLPGGQFGFAERRKDRLPRAHHGFAVLQQQFAVCFRVVQLQLTKHHTPVADEHSGAGHQLGDLGAGFAAKAAGEFFLGGHEFLHELLKAENVFAIGGTGVVDDVTSILRQAGEGVSRF